MTLSSVNNANDYNNGDDDDDDDDNDGMPIFVLHRS